MGGVHRVPATAAHTSSLGRARATETQAWAPAGILSERTKGACHFQEKNRTSCPWEHLHV